MTRIVFVNRYFYPDLSATSQMLSDLAFALQGSGTEIHVVTSRQAYDNASIRFPARECVNGIHVHRIWTSRFGRHTLLRRLFDHLTFYPAAFFPVLSLLRQGDVAVAKTDPPLICVPVYIAAALRGAAFVNWLQDLFPEVATRLGINPLRGGSLGILTWLRDWTLKNAAVNIAVGQRMAALVHKQGVPAERVKVIPNWADGSHVRPIPAESNALRNEWGLSGRFVVGYSGNLGRAHEAETILAAAELLRDTPGIVFLFIGSGHGHEQLRAEIGRRKLTNVQFRPYQPRDLLALSLPVADVHLASLRPELEGLVVPSKFYGALAAGRPVIFIGAADGELASEIGRHHCGASVEMHDGQGLADVVRRFSADPPGVAAMGEHARAAFERRFDKRHAISKWQGVLREIPGADVAAVVRPSAPIQGVQPRH